MKPTYTAAAASIAIALAAASTIAARERAARAFTAHADTFPWLWTATMLDEWLGDLRAVRGLRRSTLRGYQEAIRMLCLYLTDPAYGWPGESEDQELLEKLTALNHKRGG